jgi:hypothetical protein
MPENEKPGDVIDVAPDADGSTGGMQIAFDVAGAGVPPQAALPIFYKSPTLLRAEEHGQLAFAGVSDFAFAREVNSVPLNAVEFPLAQRAYPIVFSDDDTSFPVALLGLRQNRNLFVDALGQWAKGAYIPAYVRRYPFIFFADAKQENFALCVDTGSKFVGKDGTKFFEDGKPTDLTQNALRFCSEFQSHYQNTVAFCNALREQNLLISNRADIRLRSGGTLSVGNFRIVDENRLQVLSRDVIVSWWEKGWLPMIYAHLMSLATWAALGDRLAEEEEKK